jgi:hypothetical protein
MVLFLLLVAAGAWMARRQRLGARGPGNALAPGGAAPGESGDIEQARDFGVPNITGAGPFTGIVERPEHRRAA